jgi:MFS family permease
MDNLLVLVFFVLGAVGATHIIVDGKVMSAVRAWVKDKHIPFLGFELSDMLECHQCCGTWVGMLFWPVVVPFLSMEWTTWRLVALPAVALLSGCAISLLAVVFRSLIDWLTLSVSIPQELLNEQEEIK